jgi:carboxypeptidase Taq
MENQLIKNKIILEILEKYKDIWALNHLYSLGHWDLETYMPKDGLEARSLALSKIATMIQSLYLNDHFIDLIKKAGSVDLNDAEKGILRILKRNLKYYQKLPPGFVEDFVKTTAVATEKWKIARKNNDFNIFLPHLEKIIELSKKKSELLGYKKHPYDALLDEYEEDLTTEMVDSYFDKIKQPLIDLILNIKSKEKYTETHILEKKEYDIEKMKLLNQKILDYIHYNPNHLRMDISAHPFTSTIGKGDTRITTRYEGKDFKKSFSSTTHEYGHALYDLQSHEDLGFSPIHGGNSLVIHESQSRFWENIVGRKKEFLKLFYEDIVSLNPEFNDFTLDDIYFYFNIVKPSLIRTDADEVTYHLHIIIRYEIEKELIEGKINAKDLPDIWNKKYKTYLGLTPPNDSLGVLQDIHWSHGSIGYFPTYSMGTAFSIQVLSSLEKDLGSIDVLIKEKQGIKKIQDWLKKNIHTHGSTYVLDELSKRISDKSLDPKYLIDYLKNKYDKIYDL